MGMSIATFLESFRTTSTNFSEVMFICTYIIYRYLTKLNFQSVHASTVFAAETAETSHYCLKTWWKSLSQPSVKLAYYSGGLSLYSNTHSTFVNLNEVSFTIVNAANFQPVQVASLWSIPSLPRVAFLVNPIFCTTCRPMLSTDVGRSLGLIVLIAVSNQSVDHL